MIWIVPLLCLVVAMLIGLHIWWSESNERVTPQLPIGLHIIRRRMAVAQFKTEVRREGAVVRRVLREELEADD
jgi:hypothetical protein